MDFTLVVYPWCYQSLYVVLFPRWLINMTQIRCVTRSRYCEYTLQWRHNERDSVSNHQLHDCFLNRLFRRRSMKISKLRVSGLCVGNSPGTGEFPATMASNAENVSIWWRHHVHNTPQGLSTWLVCVFLSDASHGWARWHVLFPILVKGLCDGCKSVVSYLL